MRSTTRTNRWFVLLFVFALFATACGGEVDDAGGPDDTDDSDTTEEADGNDTTESAYFLCANRNKRSLSIDITKPEGQEIVHKLLEDADVLIQNFKNPLC